MSSLDFAIPANAGDEVSGSARAARADAPSCRRLTVLGRDGRRSADVVASKSAMNRPRILSESTRSPNAKLRDKTTTARAEKIADQSATHCASAAAIFSMLAKSDRPAAASSQPSARSLAFNAMSRGTMYCVSLSIIAHAMRAAW